MKVGNVSCYNSVQSNIKNKYSNKQSFKGLRSLDDELVTLIPDYKNALERAVKKVNFFETDNKPKSFIDMLMNTGNKIRIVFQKDGKTPSYSTEISKEGQKVRSLFFDLDGITKLHETIYDVEGKTVKSLYYKTDGVSIIKEKNYK